MVFRITIEHDKCLWTPMLMGIFSPTLLGKSTEESKIMCCPVKCYGTACILSKWSILGKKTLRGKLPFDENRQQKSIQLTSKCTCCAQPSA